MDKKQYSWNGGYHNLDAKVAGERISTLSAKADHRLTPQMVVEDARPTTSPLHGAFEWDDRLAGDEWRLSQARTLIRSLRVTIEQSPSPQVPKRMFVHVSYQEAAGEAHAGERQRYYTPVTVAMQHPAIRHSILEGALAELASFRQKYAELQELADVFTEIERLVPPPQSKGKAA